MRIKVRHATTYDYGLPVASALQMLRLTPRPHEGQFVRRWRVGVDTDARLDKSEDAFGNITHLVFLEGPLTHVEIVIEGEVDTTDMNGLVRGAIERQPRALFIRETTLTRPSPEIRRFAREAAASQGGDLLAALHDLNQRIHRGMSFKIGVTSAVTKASDAFKAKAGVCQDFAHVLIAAARSLDIPARYVSGYYLRSDKVEQEAGHAWVEAYLPSLGWIGFDPAHGHCVTDRYVRVAIGCDALEAAPVRGAQRGGDDEKLNVSIQVQQGRSVAQE